MAAQFRKAMDALYLVCVRDRRHRAGADLRGDPVGGLYALRSQQRSVLARADGGPADHRADVLRRRSLLPASASHERRPSSSTMLPQRWQRCVDMLVEIADGGDGAVHDRLRHQAGRGDLVQHHRRFPFLSVGVTYLPIPIGGVYPVAVRHRALTIGPPPTPASNIRIRH